MSLLAYLKRIFSWFKRNPRKTAAIGLAGISAGILAIAISMKDEVDHSINELKEVAAEIKRTKEIPPELPKEIKIRSPLRSPLSWKEALTKISTQAQSRREISEDIEDIIHDLKNHNRVYTHESYENIWDIEEGFEGFKKILKLSPEELSQLINEYDTNTLLTELQKKDKIRLSEREEKNAIIFFKRNAGMMSDIKALYKYDKEKDPARFLLKNSISSISDDVNSYTYRLDRSDEDLEKVNRLMELSQREKISTERLAELYELEKKLRESQNVLEKYLESLKTTLYRLKQIQ